MAQPLSERDSGDRFLAQVRNGMQAYDHRGIEIGTVERVYCGLPRANQNVADTSQIEAIAQDVVGGDRLPQMLCTHLLEQGFICIDRPGPCAEDRYLMPEQIDRIEGDRIHLGVPLERAIQP
jgi:hypothetical protein